MKLIRNTTPDGRCKYALVRLDKLREIQKRFPSHVSARPGDTDQVALGALDTLERLGLLEYGEKGSTDEHFTIKLKDMAAPAALIAYSAAISGVDPEFASDVEEMADRSMNMERKRPD